MSKVLVSKGAWHCEAELNHARANGGIQISRLNDGDTVIVYFDDPEKESYLWIQVGKLENERFYSIQVRGPITMWLHMRESICGSTFNMLSSSLVADWLYLGCCPVLGQMTLPAAKHIHLNGFDIASPDTKTVN